MIYDIQNEKSFQPYCIIICQIYKQQYFHDFPFNWQDRIFKFGAAQNKSTFPKCEENENRKELKLDNIQSNK